MPKMPKCSCCNSTSGLIRFEDAWVCGDYLIKLLRIHKRALERMASGVLLRDLLILAEVDLYPSVPKEEV